MFESTCTTCSQTFVIPRTALTYVGIDFVTCRYFSPNYTGGIMAKGGGSSNHSLLSSIMLFKAKVSTCTSSFHNCVWIYGFLYVYY